MQHKGETHVSKSPLQDDRDTCEDVPKGVEQDLRDLEMVTDSPSDENLVDMDVCFDAELPDIHEETATQYSDVYTEDSAPEPYASSPATPLTPSAVSSSHVAMMQDERSPVDASPGPSQSYNGPGAYPCTYVGEVVCSMAFKTPSARDKHLYNKHTLYKERPDVRELCGLRFGWDGHRRRHFSDVHLKVKLFQCEQCGRQFSRQCNLDRHRSRCPADPNTPSRSRRRRASTVPSSSDNTERSSSMQASTQ